MIQPCKEKKGQHDKHYETFRERYRMGTAYFNQIDET